LVRTLYMVSAVSLALWPLIDMIREADQLGIPQEQIIACMKRYPPSTEPQAFQRCLTVPKPEPFFLRHPPVTALVIAVLTAPLSLRLLRPRQRQPTIWNERAIVDD
jgi:hypothetical protein